MGQTLAQTTARRQSWLASEWARRPLALSFVALLALALLLRSALFGNPLAGYDEQFYLLTGDRLLHGALPYIDIWDRKPIGLFLLYAGIRLLGGDGVLQYQLLASGFIAATGFVIALHVRRRYSMATGLICGALYVLWTGVMGGEAGQTPLFYNLPVAIAALLTLQAVPVIGTPRGFAKACGAMALCGLALTIKTTVIFESCLFGLVLSFAAWRALGMVRTASAALVWMVLGAAPFAAAMITYAALGHFDAFWFANATSAAQRADGFAWKSLIYLLLTLAPLGPLILIAIAGRRHADDTTVWERRFLLGWIAAAGLSFVAVGYFYHHYALPLLVPLLIAGARFLEYSPHRKLALIAFTLYPATHEILINRLLASNDRAEVMAIAEAIPARVQHDCMLVFSGPPILYHLANSCLVSRFAFPDHLHAAAEAPAIGLPQQQALADALARHPGVIAEDLDLPHSRLDPARNAQLRAVLARDYRLKAMLPYRYLEDGSHRLAIWERK